MRTLPVVGDIFNTIIEAGHPLPAFQVMHYAYFSKGFLLIITYEPVPDAHIIFKRFAAVFDQTYTRFLDLQKAEAQTREAQIEVAVERVRAEAMAMHSSGDFGNVSQQLLQQVKGLGIKSFTGATIYFIDENEFITAYDFSSFGNIADAKNQFLRYDANKYPLNGKYPLKEWKKGEAYFELDFDFEKLQEGAKEFEEIDSHIASSLKKALAGGHLTHQWEACGRFSGGFIAFDMISHPDDDVRRITLKMTYAFDQAYTRFLDLQKAEAQAREARIEAALERVRSRSMAMHKSDELLESGEILFSEMQKLGIESLTAGFVLMDKEEKNGLNYTPDPSTKKIMALPVIIPHDETIQMMHVVENWKKGNSFYVVEMDEEETIKHQTFIAERSTNFTLNAEQLIAISPARLFLHNFYFKEGYLLIVGGTRLSAEQFDIMLRFAKVFQQTYTRFLDLQKAEAQAREAEIELGLERVRARAMAMQKSDELSDLVDTVFKELTKLDFALNWCIINIIDEPSLTNMVWAANPETNKPPESYLMKFEDYPFHHSMLKGYQERKTKHVYVIEGEEKKTYDNYLFNETEWRRVPKAAQDASRAMKRYVATFTFSNFGGLQTVGEEYLSEQNLDILSRFGKVFDLTYTRFNDLQKAEIQAREAQIEVAVERVRAKALAMHKSAEIMGVAVTMRKELETLKMPGFDAATITLQQDDGTIRLWDNTSAKQHEDGTWENTEFIFRLEDNHPDFYLNKIWSSNDRYIVVEQDEHDLKITTDWVRKHDKNLADVVVHYYKENVIKQAWHPAVALTYGRLNLDFYVHAPEPEVENILIKMAAAFDLAYKRFLDLQKAEAQAREAQIEAALEKVRSRSLAMQKPEELLEVAEVLRSEMGQLGVEELETSSIYIVDKEKKQAECWYAIKDIREENKQLVSDEMTITFADTWVGNEMGKFYRSKKELTSIVMKGDNRKEWINDCAGKSNVLQGYYGEEIPERTYHLVKFNGGYMGAASPGDISAESWDLLRRAASVFSLAYTRFNDLQIAEAHARQAEQDLIAIKEAKQKAEEALTELQATQKQLIQSEKMASLGELTAGIAHEIQNPLNFVNNFSEVSKELLDEMKEAIEKGDTEDAKEIMNDVIQNLEKINHHGKRADGIVKGMLQHSSSGSGKKEPTNINALADEYLRLAYHGLRAKDKSFNATMKTDFDETIGNINIIPQDIGRVVLNLITNAFYVVNEKSKQGIPGYEPTVEVSTKKEANKVLISVKDNGNGIPQKVLDKIFQPFFTTKPTGQGTGLGLSLSYDIVKAHGGELKVETMEGKGSEFIIQLSFV
jgi:signal transduction histidine kinase